MSTQTSSTAQRASARGLPFAGLRVLDVSQGISGPYCAHLLWQQGAEVVKVEPPAGDWARPIGVVRGDLSSVTIAFNGGKRAICIDAAREAGRRVLQRLAGAADVIVQNFRPGIAARLGLDPVALRAAHPELVYVSISGYGPDGPYASAPATDSVVQADAGLMFANRGADGAPRKIGLYLADMNAGLYAAQAAGAALYRCATVGGGDHIEVNLFDTCLATLVGNVVEHSMAPERAARPVLPVSSPNGTYAASDGSINVVALDDTQFERVCRALDRPQWLADPRFATAPARMANRPVLEGLVAEVFASGTVADWTERLRRFDVLHAPVRDIEQCIAHPQAVHLGTFESIEQPGIGAIAWTGHPAHAMRRPIEPVPHVGEHTLAVLANAGFTESECTDLLASGVVVQHR